MKYYQKPTMFADGGKFKHMQMGEVLDENKRETGITWSWVMHHDRTSKRTFFYNDKEYTSWDECRAAYESSP